jgi:type III secretion protein J
VRVATFRFRTVLLAAALAAGCQTPVLHNLPEADTNRAIAVLQEQGIMASKQPDNLEGGTWKVMVPRSDVVKVWSVLQQYRLPASPGRRFQDVFGKNKLVVAPIEEKALFLEALQGEISHTLETVSGVVAARVHVAIPEPDLSGQAPKGAKASVMLEYHPDASGQAPIRQEDVARLVAAAVSDLLPENVSVVMQPIELVRSQQTYDFVAFGPIVVGAGSVATLKALAFLVILLVMALGASLYWNGRVMNDLRFELTAAQRQARALQKPAKPAA